MTLAELSRWIWYAALAVYAVLGWRILRLRLPYRALAVYVLAGLVRGPFLLSFPVRSLAYTWAWAFTEPLIIALQVYMVLEILHMLKAAYPGIGKYGSRIVSGCWLIAVAGSAISALLDAHWTQWIRALPRASFLLKGSTATLLALTLWTVLWCVSYLGGDSLTPNLRRHARIAAGYFSTMAIGWFLAYSGGATGPLVSTLLGFCGLTWHMLWLVLLTRRGERRPVVEAPAPGEDLESAFAAVEAQARLAASCAHAVMTPE
jgi:hypothetical protein